jgi:hypothetical protein
MNEYTIFAIIAGLLALAAVIKVRQHGRQLGMLNVPIGFFVAVFFVAYLVVFLMAVGVNNFLKFLMSNSFTILAGGLFSLIVMGPAIQQLALDSNLTGPFAFFGVTVAFMSWEAAVSVVQKNFQGVPEDFKTPLLFAGTVVNSCVGMFCMRIFFKRVTGF